MVSNAFQGHGQPGPASPPGLSDCQPHFTDEGLRLRGGKDCTVTSWALDAKPPLPRANRPGPARSAGCSACWARRSRVSEQHWVQGQPQAPSNPRGKHSCYPVSPTRTLSTQRSGHLLQVTQSANGTRGGRLQPLRSQQRSEAHLEEHGAAGNRLPAPGYPSSALEARGAMSPPAEQDSPGVSPDHCPTSSCLKS